MFCRPVWQVSALSPPSRYDAGQVITIRWRQCPVTRTINNRQLVSVPHGSDGTSCQSVVAGQLRGLPMTQCFFKDFFRGGKIKFSTKKKVEKI